MAGSNHLFNNVTSLLGLLFEREEAQLTKREQAMITRHISLGGSQDGFRHMGVIYTQLAGAGRQRGTYGTLHSSLALEMDSIHNDRVIVSDDKDRIRQALALVLRGTHSFQDMRDALPNCMKDLIPECSKLERTRSEAFTLADNPRSYSQYMKLREKIEFYVASRLLY